MDKAILNKEEEYNLFEYLRSLEEKKRVIRGEILCSIELKIKELEDGIRYKFENLDYKDTLKQIKNIRNEMFDLENKISSIEKEIDIIKEKIILANKGLVMMVARKYGYFFPDAIQEGYIGLLRAIDKFDHTKKIKFFTYAEYWVKQFIWRAFKKEKMIRFPQYIEELLNKYYKFGKEFTALYQREPTSEEISQGLEIPLNKIFEIKRALEIIESYSLENEYKEENIIEGNDESFEDILLEDEELTLKDVVPDTKNLSSVDYIAKKRLQEQMKTVLETLTPREEKILKYRFFKDLDPEETANKFEVGRERIKQIETKALRKLRHPSRSKFLKKDFCEDE